MYFAGPVYQRDVEHSSGAVAQGLVNRRNAASRYPVSSVGDEHRHGATQVRVPQTNQRVDVFPEGDRFPCLLALALHHRGLLEVAQCWRVCDDVVLRP